MKELAIKIRHRCNTKEIWEAVNPVLDMGEMGVQIPSSGDTDNPDARWFFKFGNGKSRWKELPWASADGDFQTDPHLQELGAAADAYYTGLRIEALEQQMELMNYVEMKLTLTIVGNSILERASVPDSVTLQMGYSGNKPVDNKATLRAFDGKSVEFSSFNGKKHTFTDLKFTNMDKQKPVYTFTLEATESAHPGNGNKETQKSKTANLEFKDYVYYGYSTEPEAHKLTDTTAFLRNNLKKIANFGLSVSEDKTAPDPSGEYYYICCPYYYSLKKLVGGVTAFDADYLGNGDLDYGNGIIIPYKFYRTKDIYKQVIAMTFNVG